MTASIPLKYAASFTVNETRSILLHITFPCFQLQLLNLPKERKKERQKERKKGTKQYKKRKINIRPYGEKFLIDNFVLG